MAIHRPGNLKRPWRELISEDEAGVLQARFIFSPVTKERRNDDGGEQVGSIRVDIERPPRTAWTAVQGLLDVFLPAGYPHSVTEDYLEYQIYDSLQAFTSTIAGLLASRAVLEGVGVGDATASTTSAIILNIISTSLGRVTTIFFAHRLGTALEPECKMYRLLADIFNDLAMVLELLSPAFPRAVTVFILAVASALKALCGVAAGSSKASLSAHFARWGNLGELNAKDSSQETVIGLVGMFVGGFVVSLVQDRAATWITLLSLLAAHLWLNYKAVRAVEMRTLNRQRFSIVLAAWFENKSTVLRPADVKLRERIFERDGILREWSGQILGWVRIGLPLEEFIRIGNSDDHMRPTNMVTYLGGPISGLDTNDRYLIHIDAARRRCYIALGKGCKNEDQLHAWTVAYVALHLVGTGRPIESLVSDSQALVDQSMPSFMQALADAGWDLATCSLETQPGSRYALVA